MEIFFRDIPGKCAFIVSSFPHRVNPVEAVSLAYQQIADYLKNNNLQIVHERIFGAPEWQSSVLKEREQKLNEANIPTGNAISYLSGAPAWGRGIAGIIIQAVAGQTAATSGVVPLFHDGKPVRAQWRWQGDEYLILQNMRGRPSDPSATQTETAIKSAEKLLKSSAMNFQNVVRTWFYLDHVLDWYDDFNTVRNRLYHSFGLMPRGEFERLLLPASTGIDCANSDNSALNLNLLAIKPGAGSRLSITQLSNRGQQDAFRYGSAFSRGAAISLGSYSWLQLSGTAAIDEHGATLHRNDIAGQINCTLDKIAILLHQLDGSLADICAATVFIKRPDDISVFEKIMRQRGLSEFPGVCVVANVCRDDLLFEIDAEAIIAKHNSCRLQRD